MDQGGRFAHGEFCWADLACGDPEAAKRFYATLFGWACVDMPMPGDGSTYTLVQLEGQNVAGLYAPPPGQQQCAWSAYVAVDHCAKTTAEAVRLGGSVLAPVTDIPAVGRMAVIADPDGAVLSLWQADSPHCGFARLGPRPGTVVWNELAARSPEAAKAFYPGLFGWSVKETAMPDHAYVEWLVGDMPVGGMLPLAATGADVPPHWLVYFACEDCDGTAAKAYALGGAVLRAPFDVPEVGRIAVLADDQGAAFAVITLTMRPA